MGKILSILFIVLFCGSPFMHIAAGTNNNKKQEIRKVKTRTDYICFFEKSRKKCFKNLKQNYNLFGEDTLIEYFSISNGKVFSKIGYKYDDKKNVLEKREYSLSPFMNKKKKGDCFNVEKLIEYQYDSCNNNVLRKVYDGDYKLISSNKTIYNYLSNGKLSEALYMEDSGIINCKLIYMYDTAGNNTKQIYIDSAGKQFMGTEFVYNNKRQIVKSLLYSKQGKLSEIENCVYDSVGRKIEKYIFTPDSCLKCKFKYIYNNKNINRQVIKYQYIPEMEFQRIITDYDSSGNLTGIKRFDSDGKILREYKYIYTYYR